MPYNPSKIMECEQMWPTDFLIASLSVGTNQTNTASCLSSFGIGKMLHGNLNYVLDPSGGYVI